jgi:transaldolase
MTANRRPLRLFLDSADTSAWTRLLPLGFCHGVTTNPLLLERAGEACTVVNLRRLARAAGELGAREIHLQTWGATADELAARGADLAADGPGVAVVVKVPATAAGFAAARRLIAAGTAVTLTAVYGEGQVLAAAGLGAAYAAPYLGRLDDAGRDGRAILVRMQQLALAAADLRLLAASLRAPQRVIDLAAAGLDTFTFGPDVACGLIDEPLTRAAADDFQRAASAMGDAR